MLSNTSVNNTRDHHKELHKQIQVQSSTTCTFLLEMLQCNSEWLLISQRRSIRFIAPQLQGNYTQIKQRWIWTQVLYIIYTAPLMYMEQARRQTQVSILKCLQSKNKIRRGEEDAFSQVTLCYLVPICKENWRLKLRGIFWGGTFLGRKTHAWHPVLSDIESQGIWQDSPKDK